MEIKIELRVFDQRIYPYIDLYDTLVANDQTECPMKAVIDTIDPNEVAKFEAMADEWWDPDGKFKPLHMLNPCRLDYIVSQIALEFDRDLKSKEALQRLGRY